MHDSPASFNVAASITAQPFAASGPTPADIAIADQIRRRMNGPRLGQSVQGSNVYYARVIANTVRSRGLEPRAAVIAITTAITESGLRNYTQAVDHDSLGLFQQRPSQGWGTPAQLTDPVYATNAFLNAMLRKYPNGAWKTGDIGVICQRVQVSAYPDAYGHEVHDAQLLVDALWMGAGALPPLDKGPALTSLNGRLYLAWKGDGNNNLNLMSSTDNGRTFGHKYTSTETSPEALALAAHDGTLYIGWKGNGNNNLNVAQVLTEGDAITGLSNKLTLSDTSPKSPALASFNGRLYLAWKGDGNDQLNVMYSTDDGRTFGHKYTSTETSPEALTLVAHNGALYIGWKGDGNNNLNVAQVLTEGDAITGLSNKLTLSDTSPRSPALASFNGRLYLAWKGEGNNNLNLMPSIDDGRTFGHKYTSAETSPDAPALCAHDNGFYLGWKGDGNNNSNVAQVVIQGDAITGLSNKVIIPE
jgi:hypothetical protein